MTTRTPGQGSEDLGEQLLRVARGLRRAWMVDLSAHDLSPHEARALRVAADRQDAPRLRDLADALRIAPRSVTDVVDALEAKGYVARQPDPADRRASVVLVTEAGHAVWAAVHEARRRTMGDRMGSLTPVQRAALADALTSLEDTFDPGSGVSRS
ncbi:MarR family winged helix-turn-helix transcriptional regulator [Janibacter limosus]|uniref:MarR family winged helix-turn-helix transcriptional regulator n=1 Tax=Janibacter limosus TaxID=53458 RepID=UPI00082FE453|nr:MarR family transcriptional regulator [Janibacter limosus]